MLLVWQKLQICVDMTGNTLYKHCISLPTITYASVWQKELEIMQFIKWKRQNKKHVTTYQHTLGEGNSRPAAAPLNTPPSPAPPTDIQESRRRREHHLRQTAAPYEYWMEARLGPHMALDHTLKNWKNTSFSLSYLFLVSGRDQAYSRECWEWGRNTTGSL